MKINLFQKERIQMTFKRLLMPMLVMGIMLIMASAAFAQAPLITCGLSVPIGSTPRASSTGHTEVVGAGSPAPGDPLNGGIPTVKVSPPAAGGGTIRVTCINSGGAGSPTDPGVVALTLNFGVPITNTTGTHPSAGTQIRVANNGGAGNDFCVSGPCPDAVVAAPNVSINTTSYSGGQVVIGLGTPATLGGTPNTGIS